MYSRQWHVPIDMPQYLTPVSMALGAVIVPISSLLKHECRLTNRYIERDPRSPHAARTSSSLLSPIALCKACWVVWRYWTSS